MKLTVLWMIRESYLLRVWVVFPQQWLQILSLLFFWKAKRGCCRACQRLGELNDVELRESSWLRRCCVKSVKSKTHHILRSRVSSVMHYTVPSPLRGMSSPHYTTPASSHETTAPSTVPTWTGHCSVGWRLPGPPQPSSSCALCSRRQPPSWPPLSAILLKFAKWDSWLARGFHSNWPSASIISLMRTVVRI